ncbi:MAG: Kae1-associated kinase Bud32 [Candidatus Aenigmatarchaeota archaeon]|nr:MAG: Kae1-associated kinase Bud32 [Candidatus Aenigmarchaeota archaeon]
MIHRGAEAVLYRSKWQGLESLVKKRVKKGYRIKELDVKLRKERTKKEASLLSDARRIGVLTPKVFSISDFIIEMEMIEGEKLKDVLNDLPEKYEIIERVGEIVGKLHSSGIIHGDITTSNMILRGDDIYLIDFGLGFHSRSVEDRAVDIHLFHRALESTHFKYLNQLWKSFLRGYRKTCEDYEEVISRVNIIRKRGRYA